MSPGNQKKGSNFFPLVQTLGQYLERYTITFVVPHFQDHTFPTIDRGASAKQHDSICTISVTALVSFSIETFSTFSLRTTLPVCKLSL